MGELGGPQKTYSYVEGASLVTNLYDKEDGTLKFISKRTRTPGKSQKKNRHGLTKSAHLLGTKWKQIGLASYNHFRFFDYQMSLHVS